MTKRIATGGMTVFTLMLIGQLVSLTGSGLTTFALGVWVFQRTGSVTQFALISVFIVLPAILISPFAGALVDRWDRRTALILSDAGAGLCVLGVALLLYAERLEVWHIYIANTLISLCTAFQWPAFSAAISLLVSKKQLGRASGMVQTVQAISRLVSPVLAGVLVVTIKIHGVILIDFATFLFSLVTLLLIAIPRPVVSQEGAAAKGTLLSEATYGWKYVKARPGLLGLLIFFAVSNFLLGVVTVLATPLVLTFASAAVLGVVLSVGGSGMLVGSLLMSIWGGPKRRIYGVIGFMMLSALCMVLAGARSSASLLAVAAFIFFFGLPISLGSSQAIWQSKVAPDVQGRVFAIRSMIAWSAMPLAYLCAGPLADRLFEPLLAPGGKLNGSIGRLIGVGPGRGIGLLFITMGFITAMMTIAGFLYPRLRLVEDELPDVIQEPAPATSDEQEQVAANHQPLVLTAED
ncbi:MAG: transporter, family, macrolide efflux protein [Blastocatellia bacterium]|nr:transporter, family, macrolide efflux protein [Blastocatellia bacterium]